MTTTISPRRITTIAEWMERWRIVTARIARQTADDDGPADWDECFEGWTDEELEGLDLGI